MNAAVSKAGAKIDALQRNARVNYKALPQD